MRRFDFGAAAPPARDPLTVLLDPNPMRWSEFDSLSQELRDLLNEYGHPDVRKAARFVGEADSAALGRALAKQRSLRQARTLTRQPALT